MNEKNLAIILAAGQGTRMKTTVPKQYLFLNKKPIISMVINTFLEHKLINFVKVVISESQVKHYEKISSKIKSHKLLSFEIGGRTRAESVCKGLRSCTNLLTNESDKVLIHDAARPFISRILINKLLKELKNSEAVFPGLPITDALWLYKQSNVKKGPSRESLVRAQTPQGFYFNQFIDLFSGNYKKQVDDISIAHANNLKISCIPGDPMNIKLTNPEDLEFARKVVKNWK